MKVSSLTIAIPAYNEEASVSSVIEDALQMGARISTKFQLLLVDDGSTDKTLTIMQEKAKIHKNITIIKHLTNKGFSGAIKSCYRESLHEWIFLAPADGQISMDILPRFIELTPQADVIVGFRTTNPEPLSRKINSYIFHRLYRLLFGVKLKEISTAILWKKTILDSISISANDRSALIQPEVIYKAWKSGAIFKQVGFPYCIRKGGVPKGSDPTMIVITLKEMFRLFRELRAS